MKQTLRRIFVAGAAAALLASPVAAFAHDGDDDSVSNSGPRKERVSQLEDQLRDRLEAQKDQRLVTLADKKENLRERLEGAKKKACENHVTTINKLMTVMDKRRGNAIDRIAKIAEAVEAFKVKKNIDVANYDELVAKVDAAKAVATSATEAQQQIPSLDCSGEHPRADVADFKEKRSTSIDAVKAYRDAVKDLVKAVKTAVGASKSTSPSPTPEVEGGDQ